VAEWYWDSKARQRQLTDLQQSAKLREFFASVRHPGSQLYGIRPERIIVDPSAASFIRQLWADKALFDGGLSVMGADNAVIDGIRLVSSLVATGRLLVHKSCANLIDQMQSYSWDKKAAERGEDKPQKVNDHAVDALRYSVKTTHQLWRGELVPAETPKSYQDHFGVAL
jgi:hypothetical protein